jgi:hypothetical protein
MDYELIFVLSKKIYKRAESPFAFHFDTSFFLKEAKRRSGSSRVSVFFGPIKAHGGGKSHYAGYFWLK